MYSRVGVYISYICRLTLKRKKNVRESCIEFKLSHYNIFHAYYASYYALIILLILRFLLYTYNTSYYLLLLVYFHLYFTSYYASRRALLRKGKLLAGGQMTVIQHTRLKG